MNLIRLVSFQVYALLFSLHAFAAMDSGSPSASAAASGVSNTTQAAPSQKDLIIHRNMMQMQANQTHFQQNQQGLANLNKREDLKKQIASIDEQLALKPGPSAKEKKTLRRKRKDLVSQIAKLESDSKMSQNKK